MTSKSIPENLPTNIEELTSSENGLDEMTARDESENLQEMGSEEYEDIPSGIDIFVYLIQAPPSIPEGKRRSVSGRVPQIFETSINVYSNMLKKNGTKKPRSSIWGQLCKIGLAILRSRRIDMDGTTMKFIRLIEELEDLQNELDLLIIECYEMNISRSLPRYSLWEFSFESPTWKLDTKIHEKLDQELLWFRAVLGIPKITIFAIAVCYAFQRSRIPGLRKIVRPIIEKFESNLIKYYKQTQRFIKYFQVLKDASIESPT